MPADVDGADEDIGHRRRAEISLDETEGLDCGGEQGGALGGPLADSLVLHEDRPSLCAGPREPLDICDLLVCRNAVDLCERVDS
jgi:hypothetical protein